MKTQRSLLRSLSLALLSAGALSSTTFAAPVNIGAGTYTENFNTLSAGSEPAVGWDIRDYASASSLGIFGTANFQNSPRDWSHDSGQFKNVSSVNIPQTSDITAQNANTNRAMGLNQVFVFGDPGAAFNFNFSSTGVQFSSISIDLLLTNNTAASTTFSIQYGIGADPTSFTTLATWSDADVAGGWGSTTFTFDREDFGSNLDDQSQAWFRVVALTPATNGGGAYDQVAIDNFSISATTAVPEPSTYALLALGGLGAWALARRRKTLA